ncbi:MULTISPECIES: hypothetical protein [unclassified Nonomuraea]|uniref:hypothetical protein n=1 Tax=unclassified Nonomuraea TaxID=2593643 RepID=UPI003409B38B
MGTPSYIAPEQLVGLPAGARGWPLDAGKAAVEKAGDRNGRDWIGKVAALSPPAGATACTGSEVEMSIGVK